MAPQLPPDDLDLVGRVWLAGRPLHRIHAPSSAANAFNPTAGPGRFRPVYRGQSVVPTLYGGANFDCALSETIFHDVPLSGVRAVAHADVASRVRSVVIPARDLMLAELHGHGLRRLGLRQSDIVDFDDDGYRISRAWGQAIYDWRSADGDALDGIVWMSRQFNSEEALMLFGSLRGDPRVSSRALRIDRTSSNIPLDEPATLERVYAAANRAGITIVSPGF